MANDQLAHAVTMLAAGVGIPVLASLNAQLGQRIGSPPAAAAVLFLVAAGVALAVTVLSSGASALSEVPAQPPRLFLAGILIAFYVLSITWIAPRFGLGNAVFCVLLGQIASASAIDHFGLFGVTRQPLNLTRGSGIAAMALGLILLRLK